MLNNAKTLIGYGLSSLEGEIGKVDEFYFDDHFWTIRYLVANTGSWLIERQVLLSPYALASINKNKKTISINLTKEQIEKSPSLDRDKPVSRQFEKSYYMYYGWPMYWSGSNVWGAYDSATIDMVAIDKIHNENKEWDSHLRSTKFVVGYHIESTNGEIGHVEDFIIDNENWTIRYLVVDTTNWLPGKKVLVSPHWIDKISWSESKVYINLSREAIEEAPEYKKDSPLTRNYENILHNHYNIKGYWINKI